METIPKADCENIGFFRKTHGIHGGLILEFEPQFEYSVEDANRVFVELDGLLVPFFVDMESKRFISGNSAIVKLNWVETEKYAKRLVGNSVYLFLDEISDKDKEPFESKMENYLLIDKKLGEIGLIKQVDDYAGNIVLTVSFRGEELLIPYNDELLDTINETLKTITLILPEGLIEAE